MPNGLRHASGWNDTQRNLTVDRTADHSQTCRGKVLLVPPRLLLLLLLLQQLLALPVSLSMLVSLPANPSSDVDEEFDVSSFSLSLSLSFAICTAVKAFENALDELSDKLSNDQGTAIRVIASTNQFALSEVITLDASKRLPYIKELLKQNRADVAGG